LASQALLEVFEAKFREARSFHLRLSTDLGEYLIVRESDSVMSSLDMASWILLQEAEVDEVAEEPSSSLDQW
jgi:hypothetical protein